MSTGTADPARVRLGRIRCLTNSAESMKKGSPLPLPLCFVAKEVNFEYSDGKEPLKVHEERSDNAKVIDKLPEGKNTEFTCSGLAMFNSEGGWMKMTSPHNGWVLLQPSKRGLKGTLKIAPGTTSGKKSSEAKEPVSWIKVVERMCSLQIVKSQQVSNIDEEESNLLQTPPPGWNLEADEELAQYLVKYLDRSESGGLGGPGGEHFSRVEVSSEEDAIKDLLDPDLEDKYWESDGSQGQHWIRFHMKPGTLIEKFIIHVDPDDGSYLPKRVIVKAGSVGDMTTIASKNFGTHDYEKKELNLLSAPMAVCYNVIEVHIKSCYQGMCSN